MAPQGETIKTNSNRPTKKPISKPLPRVSNDGLQRTKSDTSFELSKEAMEMNMNMNVLTPISEVEDAKCECCGISEECTPEYIEKVRGKFSGKWICGLCSEAVKEEMEKNGGKMEVALDTHIHACVKFNKFGRAYPVLYQAEAMREMLKKKNNKNNNNNNNNMKSNGKKIGGIARSSSCIPAITRDLGDFKLIN